MDRIVRRFDGETDGDLILCIARGIAYQRNMNSGRVEYSHAYYEKVLAYEGTPIARAVNAGRVAFLASNAIPGASVLDYGSGTGGFLRAARSAGFDARGYEVMPPAVGQLQRDGLYQDLLGGAAVVTFWDVLEHLDDPGRKIESMDRGAVLLASVPIFDDLRKIRESKHYRPGEHLYYWTKEGFVAWAAIYGFRLLAFSSHETDAGREQIGAFAFKRDLPDFVDHIGLYDKMHSTTHYGSSASELHLDAVNDFVKRVQPRSILDFGCGRSDLVAHFWLDGARKIARYDPAIPRFKDMPEGRFDLVLCCDVMEHIPIIGVDRLLSEIKSRGDVAVFTISTKLARAKLPDGRNAHVTLLTRGEWRRWIASYFGGLLEEKPSQWDHELIFLAGFQKRERLCSACGGEMEIDFFRGVRNPKDEWFRRCVRCGALSESKSTKEEAEKL